MLATNEVCYHTLWGDILLTVGEVESDEIDPSFPPLTADARRGFWLQQLRHLQELDS